MVMISRSQSKVSFFKDTEKVPGSIPGVTTFCFSRYFFYIREVSIVRVYYLQSPFCHQRQSVHRHFQRKSDINMAKLVRGLLRRFIIIIWGGAQP